MRNERQKECARARAEIYAPAPKDTRLLYGIIASFSTIVAIVLAGGFYSIDVLQHPFVLIGLALLAFGAGLIVRRVRARRHRQAHRLEYDKASALRRATDQEATWSHR